MRTPEFTYAGAPDCNINGVSCSPLGTMYSVEVWTRKYQTDAFICRVAPEPQRAPEKRTLLIDPDRVKGITAPAFDDLSFNLPTVLNNSLIDQMQNLTGEGIYKALPAKKKACLLNVAAKASHPSSARMWQHVEGLRRLEQDRVFALVAPGCLKLVGESDRFDEAPNWLHEPMPGFQREKSFKSRDTHANLQVSFMKNAQGQWAADIDIDEASGFGHALEVVRNIFGGPTEPYQVRELLLMHPPNPEEFAPPDPGYSFIF